MLTVRSQTARLLCEDLVFPLAKGVSRGSGWGLVDTILANRGIVFITPEEREVFFSPSFEHLHDPFLMDGMQSAVDRILLARENKERVVIFGDYDVDGVSSTAMLVRFLTEIGMTVSYRLPHRVHDGYGMKNYFMDELAEKDVKLVITVDCGTRDAEVIRYARTKGIDVIVSDHHAVPDEVPDEVIAILNPKIRESGYPFSYLSGSGVAFKIVCALSEVVSGVTELADSSLRGAERRGNLMSNFHPRSPRSARDDEHTMIRSHFTRISRYVDFAALGTIADCMPLIGENRTIASLGLRQLKNTQSNGLRRLIEGKYSDMDADIVGFHIGPRINAAGRMDSPYKALSMLLAGEDRMDEILWELESLNTKRKLTTEYFTNHAMEIVDRDRTILFYDSTEIEHGIIGLIAGRLTEAFGKPSIALKDEWDQFVASCRSPEHINIVELLEQCKHHFVRFGGHRQAAGFTIRREHLAPFRDEIESLLRAGQDGTADTSKKTLDIDLVLTPGGIDTNLLRALDSLKPYGIGNRKPLFLVRDFPIAGVEYLGKDGKHLRFVTKTRGLKVNGFGLGEHYEKLRGLSQIGLIAEIGEEEWMGRKSIVLNVRDIILAD